jgi:hypothetical protein
MSFRYQHFFRAPAALVVVLAAFTGCANMGTTTTNSAKLSTEATSHHIYEGEITTIVTRSMNTLGTDADIEWSTTGGKLDTEQNGRIARVKFDKPGTFIITAKLKIKGQIVDTEQEEIQVSQLVTYNQ